MSRRPLSKKQLAAMFARMASERRSRRGARARRGSATPDAGPASKLKEVSFKSYKDAGGSKGYGSMQKVGRAKSLNSGVSETYVTRLSDGERIHKVLFKPKDNSELGISQDTDLELFAYEIGTKLGLPIPATEEKALRVSGKDRPGIAMQWVDLPAAEDCSYDELVGLKNYDDMRAFDFIIGNTDRHDGNYLVDVSQKMVVPIDHNSCGWRTPKRYSVNRLTPEFRKRVLALDVDDTVKRIEYAAEWAEGTSSTIAGEWVGEALPLLQKEIRQYEKERGSRRGSRRKRQRR